MVPVATQNLLHPGSKVICVTASQRLWLQWHEHTRRQLDLRTQGKYNKACTVRWAVYWAMPMLEQGVQNLLGCSELVKKDLPLSGQVLALSAALADLPAQHIRLSLASLHIT